MIVIIFHTHNSFYISSYSILSHSLQEGKSHSGDHAQHIFRVLSLEGGGVRSIVQVVILSRIIAKYPTFLDGTSLFCGCSSSSFVVFLILCGYPLQTIIELMEEMLTKTLKKTETNGIRSSKFRTEWMHVFCDMLFGNLRMKDLQRRALVPAYRLDNKASSPEERKGETVLFNNFSSDTTDDTRLTDVCLRSCAVPTYFHPHQGYVDCRVFGNNPSFCAWPLVFGAQPQGLAIPPGKTVCLDIGNGYGYKRFMDEDKLGDGGLCQWNLSVIDVLHSSSQSFADQAGKLYLGDRYFRFFPFIREDYIRMDDWKYLQELKDFALTCNLNPLFVWIEKHWL